MTDFDTNLLLWHRERNPRAKAAIMSEKIWPIARQRFQGRVEELRATRRIRDHHVLIAIVSTHELVLYSIDAYRPQHVYLLCSPDNADSAVNLRQAIIADQEYDNSYSEQTVQLREFSDNIGTTDIYRVIKAIRQQHAADQTIVIDITGGKTSMKTGAAMAGTWIGATISTIEVDYPRLPGIEGTAIGHGTQRPAVIEDPYHVFGDQDRDRALVKMAGYDYQGAVEILTGIVARLGDEHGDRQLLLLADAYCAWEAFDLRTAHQLLTRLYSVPQFRLQLQNGWLADQIDMLDACLELNQPGADVLRLLRIPRTVHSFVAMLLAAAERRKVQSRLDQAMLVLYRCLEFLAQQRMVTYDLVASRFWRDQGRRRLAALFADRGFALTDDMYRGNPGLKEKYEILQKLDDPLILPGDLKKLPSLTAPRNETIFAHGFHAVTDVDYERIQKFTFYLVERWRRLTPFPERTPDELDRLYRHAAFIQPVLTPGDDTSPVQSVPAVMSAAVPSDETAVPETVAAAAEVQPIEIKVGNLHNMNRRATGELMPVQRWLKDQGLHGRLADVSVKGGAPKSAKDGAPKSVKGGAPKSAKGGVPKSVKGDAPQAEKLRYIGFIPAGTEFRLAQQAIETRREQVGRYIILFLAAPPAADPTPAAG